MIQERQGNLFWKLASDGNVSVHSPVFCLKTYADLFCGIGGFHVAAKQLGTPKIGK